MKTRLFLICALASVALAADLPYAGKWKVNLAKSDFGQTTVTYESLPGGEWQTTAFGVTYKFKMDDKEYPDGMGGTIAWTFAIRVGLATGLVTGVGVTVNPYNNVAGARFLRTWRRSVEKVRRSRVFPGTYPG